MTPAIHVSQRSPRFDSHSAHSMRSCSAFSKMPLAIRSASSREIAWDTLSAGEREIIIRSARWVTGKGTLNSVGRRLLKSQWADICEGTQDILIRNAFRRASPASSGILGTVTEVMGDKVYAFGHNWNAIGDSFFPMATGYVHTIVSSKYLSFKLGQPVEIVGAGSG